MVQKPRWWYNQSAALPVLGNRLVLVTTRKSKRWIIPKGIIEKDMTPEDSAVKEAYEEGGIVGKAGNKEIGRFSYAKWGGLCTVRVYPLYVEQLLDAWEDMLARERKVVTVDEAVDMVCYAGLAKIMQAFFGEKPLTAMQ